MNQRNRKQTAKIPLYTRRTVSEVVNTTFDFVKENWRPWLRLSVYVMLPISIVQGMGLNSIFAALFNDTDFPVMAVVIAGVFTLIGAAACSALQIALLKWYDTHDDRLERASLTSMRPMLLSYFLKCLPIWLLIALVSLPGTAVSLAVSLLLPVAVLLFLAAMLPVWLTAPVYLLEGCSFWVAVKRAFVLGYSRWLKLVGVGFCMALAAMIMQNLTTIPWSVLLVSVQTLGDKSSAYEWKVFSELMFYVFTILQCMVAYLGMSFFVLAMSFYYANVATDVDQVNIESEIENFENL